MGLIHPVDLEAHRRAQAARQSFRHLRHLRGRFRRGVADAGYTLHLPADDPAIVLALDARTLSSQAAVLGVLAHLDQRRVAILTPEGLDPFGDGDGDRASRCRPVPIAGLDELSRAAPEVRVTVSAGVHVAAGELAHAWMQRVHGRSIVAQHGMLLPQVAPLPPGATLAAWSAPDADFWRSGRDDVDVEVFGSELLARASRALVAPVDPGAPPVFCGALHGTELPRSEIERVARRFCLATGAAYRPHPAETDVQSRATHAIWKLLGVRFASTTCPLIEIASPVVGMWSTGILEAATAGLPAWVHHPDPPEWVLEVWGRYGLSRWGSEPTPASPLAGGEPARHLAEFVLAACR